MRSSELMGAAGGLHGSHEWVLVWLVVRDKAGGSLWGWRMRRRHWAWLLRRRRRADVEF